MKENNVNSYKIEYKTRRRLFSVLYAFLKRADLTNPEVTFFTKSEGVRDPIPLSFSRNGDYNGRKLPDDREWSELCSSPGLSGILAVAGTNKADTRRVVVCYIPNQGFDYSLVITFPNATGGMNRAEQSILDFLGTFS